MEPKTFAETIGSGLAALDGIIAVLASLASRPDDWRRARAERERGELQNLRGRLGDTTEEDWESGAAASWLSPLDVSEIRGALLTAWYRREGAAVQLAVSAADDLEALAGALAHYLSTAGRTN